MKNLTIYTDGASRGNPGNAASAWLILNGTEVLESEVISAGKNTNNFAEYTAIISALKSAVKFAEPTAKIELFSDSELVISQMNGRYAVKSENLVKLNAEAKTAAKKFASVTFTHVPRENPYIGSCDWLCNQALDMIESKPPKKSEPIICNPIGIVHSPFLKKEDCPKQGKFTDKLSRVEVFEKYREGLEGLSAGDKVFILCWFDKSERDILKVHPHGQSDGKMRGVFATRAPVRPNPISLTLTEIVSIDSGIITVKGLEALNKTPVLDIKPFYADTDN
ncbi:MAG: tRNA (N6-threonylcarbamoyladenosine(37)-N6)-methyltransferase TrmO [Methanocorpusculum sp.]|nr:tRNA (N6-threonylcarbamoyladenosine(37)-N6)-methyltransferase TrmO [Methanocorpusculum sp.]